MDINAEKRVKEYIKRLEDLYGQVKEWLAGRPFRFIDKNIDVTEMVPGVYSAPALEIRSDKDTLIATLEPVGAWIIGALGRVDLKGKYETASLLYLAEGGPHITITIAGEEGHPAPFFRGVEHAGWYWIESGRLGRARSLNAELFFDLLSEISDYEQ